MSTIGGFVEINHVRNKEGKVMKKLLFPVVALFQFAWVLSAGQPTYTVITEPEQGVGPIVSLINNAKVKVWLSTYEICCTGSNLTCQPILDALAAAKLRGVDVQLILSYGLFGSSDSARQTREYEQNLCSENNIPCVISSNAFTYFHNKYMLIDNYIAVVMTGNFTQIDFPPFGNTRNFCVVAENDYKLFNYLNTLFSADLMINAPFNLAYTPSLGAEETELIISSALGASYAQTEVIDKIVSFLGKTTSSLDIYMMYFDATCPQEIIDAIVSVANRGIPVRIILSTVQDTNAKTYQTLIATKNISSVIVNSSTNPFPFIHTKVFLSDRSNIIVGSINMDNTGPISDREVDMVSSIASIVNPIQSTFDSDWAKFTQPK